MSEPNPLRAYSLFVSCENDPALRDLRDACVQVSWEAGHSPRALLSSIGRADVRREIRECDVFVRICSSLNGSTATECFWANDAHKPILLLLSSPDGSLQPDQSLLKNSVAGSSARLVSIDPYAVAKEYLVALHHAARTLDASSSTNWSLLQGSEVYIRNPFWRRFAARVSQWATLDSRFHLNAPLKQAAAEFFLDRYFGILKRAAVSRLFFESGSAIAFLSEAFAARIDEEAFNKWGAVIESNNFISYMEFILKQFPRLTLYPSGRPERRYGGTFGRLMELSVPAEGAHPIQDAAYDLMCDIRSHFAEQYTDLGVIFGAASGIDLSRGTELFGPHVGSYENMLFKRALLESGAPVILFIDEDKVPRRAVPGECFLVCDEEFSWYYACRNTPLAIVCAFRSEDRAKSIIPDFQYLGLEHLESGRHGEAPWPLIASNDLFWSRRQEWLTCALGQIHDQDGGVGSSVVHGI